MAWTLIDSSRRYYDFLEQNGRGLEEIPLLRIVPSPKGVILEVKSKVLSTENLLLRVLEEEWRIGEEELVAESFDEKRGLLSLECSGELAAHLQRAQGLRLFSDLKFLVKNVERFYLNHEEELILPRPSPLLIPPSIERLSSEQQKAIETIFAHPLSYIWGAPGTGKTRGVLFESLLWTLGQGVRAILLAPTNNALEQALLALLPQFDELGMERANVLRLGTPSARFLELYPEVCDPLSVRDKEATLFDFGSHKKSPKERMEEALVLAMTVDNFIKRFETLPLGGKKHLFLDEAAFTPLIKAITLCASQAPLTMLGDHKQLPPVCEAPEREMRGENQTLKAWHYSALHLESYMRQGEVIFEASNPLLLPPFMTTQMVCLSRSHRYGENLTRLLDEHIYQMGLTGLEKKTELYYIDSGAGERVDSKGYSSPMEAKAMRGLVGELLGSEADFGIITPFVLQKKAILEHHPELRGKERVMTIHGSQGQEFETVILSPVTLHYHLTNSKNPAALHALNVAVSRAKGRIVLVCDYAFWMKQKGQFLSALLRECEPLGQIKAPKL